MGADRDNDRSGNGLKQHWGVRQPEILHPQLSHLGVEDTPTFHVL